MSKNPEHSFWRLRSAETIERIGGRLHLSFQHFVIEDSESMGLKLNERYSSEEVRRILNLLGEI